MKLRLALEEKELDVRLRDRLVAEGKVSRTQVETYLSSLAEEPASGYEKVMDEEESQGTTEQ